MIGWPTRRPGHPYLAGAPLLIAHRGGARLAPENTMAAFRQAVQVFGADMLEMDVHRSADGEVVVIHDPTVDRTTDGTGAVRDLSWEALRDLDAGYRFEDLEGSHSFRGTGERLPLLREVLETFPHIRVNVEAKVPEVAVPLARLVREMGAHDRVLIAVDQESTRSGILDYPGPRGASRQQMKRFFVAQRLGVLGRGYTPRADALQIPDAWEGTQVASRSFVREAHLRNIPVHVWTIDEPGDMRRLLDWGVDGIQSDRPDLLARVLHEETGRPLPAGLRSEGPDR
jgi:glycerophosphoryl diester phosphodiesterase